MSIATDVPEVLVGRYRLLERLGEGGMGVVWRALDLDLEEEIAIKFLREDLATDAALRAGFRREVKLARRVTHPNVARVYEFGRAGGLFFLTMEYVEGESLQSRIDREAPLSAALVGTLAVSLCRGLAAAHAAGVVHGDIKPGNVLLSPRRGAVLTDFGIARVRSGGDDDDGGAGTPLYMAPEQLTGGGSSFESDVYAVGVVLLEALTGKVPWPTESMFALIDAKCGGRRDPDLRALAPALPEPWVELLGECLRRDPAGRPGDAQALLLRLSMVRGAMETTARSEPPASPLASRGPRWIEVVPFTGDRHEARSSEWIERDLADALTQVRGLRVISPAAASREPTQPTGADTRTQIYGEVRAVDDGVVVAVSVVDPASSSPTLQFELHQRKTAIHNLGAELASRIAATVDPEGAHTVAGADAELDSETARLYVDARRAYLAWRADEALGLFEAARHRAPDHRQIRIGHLKALMMARTSLRSPGAGEIDDVARVVEAAVAECGDLGEAHLAQAIVRRIRDDPAGCAASLRRALTRAPSLVVAHAMLADLLIDIDRLPDAERHLEIALALDPGSALVWSTRTRLFAAQGRWPAFHESKAHLQPRLAKLIYLRGCIWDPDADALAWLDDEFDADDPSLPTELQEQARAILDVLHGRGDRRAHLGRLAGSYRRQVSRRSSLILAQVLCELHCQGGDVHGALRWLQIADQRNLVDRRWLDRCPLLAHLRGLPAFARIHARVRARADEVAEAIWDATPE